MENLSSAQEIGRTSAICAHCQNLCTEAQRIVSAKFPDLSFCCIGCAGVYSFLNNLGLNNYYDLQKTQNSFKNALPISWSPENYEYLDDPQWRAQNIKDAYTLQLQADGSAEKKSPVEQAFTVQFYLENVHCLACLWLLEKISNWVEGVVQSKLDLSKSILTVWLQPGASLKLLASFLSQIGYRPHILTQSNDWLAHYERENRKYLLRIGIAAGCSSNVMLYAISVYAGASGIWATSFSWISFVLTLPVLFYAAVPFYQNAWFSFRKKNLSIDFPIVLALWAAEILSVYYLLNGHSERVYFDSVTMLVSLLLSTRYGLRKVQENLLNQVALLKYFIPTKVKRLKELRHEWLSLEQLEIGDIIELSAEEIIPVDGVISCGSSRIDASLLTGESFWQKVERGDSVFAGCKNITQKLEVQVIAVDKETRLGKILSDLQRGLGAYQTPFTQMADRWAQTLLIIILAMCGLLIAYYGLNGNLFLGWHKSLALLLITCPCALAFAAPLTYSLTLTELSKEGILIKNAEVLEKLQSIKNVFLDKTGTLTYGKFELNRVLSANGQTVDLDQKSAQLLWQMESKSLHPIAKAFRNYLSPKFSQQILEEKISALNQITEVAGVGVKAEHSGKSFQIKSFDLLQSAWDKEMIEALGPVTAVGLYEDSLLKLVFILGDSIRPDSPEIIRELQNRGYNVHLLSGDQKTMVDWIQKVCGISHNNCEAQIGPEAKKQTLLDSECSMMVGDGANDSLALSAASVGVAVSGGLEMCLSAAGIYLSSPGISGLIVLFDKAQQAIKTVKYNFVISTLYNILGFFLVIQGALNPLWAAILMPLSSITVMLQSYWGVLKNSKT